MVREWYCVIVLIPLLLVVDSGLVPSCGKRKVVNRLVVNGAEAKDGFWPWYATIFHKHDRSFSFVCGGTILDQNTVLTAAHCLRSPNGNGIIKPQNVLVKAGRIQLSVAGSYAKEYEAFKIIVHPKYKKNSIEHDIGLIKLATDITNSNFIQPICLCNQEENQNALVGSLGTIVGFGIDETGNPSDTLREANIPVVSAITCIESNREVFGKHLTSDMFCAGNRDGISACNGDSGGGLYFNQNGTWVIRGVVSFTKPRDGGTLCDTKEYTVFSDVAKYIKWIKAKMRRTDTSVQQHRRIQTKISVEHENPKIELLPMSTCGANKYRYRSETSKPIMFGYPWVALLEYTDYTESDEDYDDDKPRIEILCQATLISEFYLLTSASCIYAIPKRYTLKSVRLGDYDKDMTTDCAKIDNDIVCSPPVQTREIKSIITHKNYNNETLANDIALIRLRDRADTSQPNVKPICLPVTDELRNQKATHYTATAWVTCTCTSLLERSVREVISVSECQQLFNELESSTEISNNQICIKQSREISLNCKVPYQGSTLKLVKKVQGISRYVMYGILLSSSQNCNWDIPDVHLNVANYVDWILENIEK